MMPRVLLPGFLLVGLACESTGPSGGTSTDIQVLNGTAQANVRVTVQGPRGGSQTKTIAQGFGVLTWFDADLRTAGEEVRFTVVAGSRTTTRSCHVLADAIRNDNNVPSVIVLGEGVEPLHVQCASGWNETD
jgi:hypothetical protein